MVKRYFAIDSGMYLVIDPCYLDRFMQFFDYDKMVDSKNMQAYVGRVMKKAYPRSPKGSVALVESFGGDGQFSVEVDRYGFGTIERLAPKVEKLEELKGTEELHAVLPIMQGGKVR